MHEIAGSPAPTADKYQFGMHVCSIYRNRAEQIPVLTALFSEGLAARQKALYIGDEHAAEEVGGSIDSHCVHQHSHPVSQHISFTNSRESYMPNGNFDYAGMYDHLDQEVFSAAQEGYTGIRIAGDMSWFQGSNTPLESLISYETKLNQFVPSRHIVGICEYQEGAFSPEALIDMICAHPFLIVYGKLYENKYLYRNERSSEAEFTRLKPVDYTTVISIITDEEPLHSFV